MSTCSKGAVPLVVVVLLGASGCDYDWSRFEPVGGSADASVDASRDASVDASMDASADASVDASRDASVDDAGDASIDASTDASGINIPGLVLYFPFDEGAGTSTVETISGSSADVRGPTFIAGIRGSGLRFVSGDTVVAPLPAPLDVHMGYTVTVWVRVADGTTGLIASSHGDPHWTVGYSSIAGDNGQLSGISARPDYADWPMYRLLGPRPIADEWQHVAFTVDGSDLALYVNGSLVGTGQRSIPPREPAPESFLYLGVSGYDHFTNHFTGDMDELRVYNRPLAATEIESLASR